MITSFTYKKKINKKRKPVITGTLSSERLLMTCYEPVFTPLPLEKWIDVEVPSFGLQFALKLNRVELEKVRELKKRLEEYLK